MIFGSRLKKLREQNNLSKKQLGNILNKTANNISQYETGKREPNFDALIKISALFCVSVDYLLGIPDAPVPSSAPVIKKPEWFEGFIDTFEPFFFNYDQWSSADRHSLYLLLLGIRINQSDV